MAIGVLKRHEKAFDRCWGAGGRKLNFALFSRLPQGIYFRRRRFYKQENTSVCENGAMYTKGLNDKIPFCSGEN